MSQNLDLDITLQSTGGDFDPKLSNIRSSDSDVTNDWADKIGESYPPRATTTSLTTGSTTQTETYSWDLGQYVINAPTATTACANNATGLASCTMFTDVTGWTASDDPNFYKNNGGSSVNASTKTYDAHYLVGNYYQWNAATAGTGGEIVSQNATGSICPKGWKLPNSGNSTTKGTFGYMLSQYGVQSKPNVAAGADVSPVNGNEYDIALSPLFLMRGGVVYPKYPSDPYRGAGSGGGYWSSWAGSSSSAYWLYFSTSVTPSGNIYRYSGYSLRCLIPTP